MFVSILALSWMINCLLVGNCVILGVCITNTITKYNTHLHICLSTLFHTKKNNFILKKQENYADYEKDFFYQKNTKKGPNNIKLS